MKPEMAASRSTEIMTKDEVATWLKVKPRQVERLGIPCLNFGHKTKRYFVDDVVAWLDSLRSVAKNVNASPPGLDARVRFL
jgi:hypothetical protein